MLTKLLTALLPLLLLTGLQGTLLTGCDPAEVKIVKDRNNGDDDPGFQDFDDGPGPGDDGGDQTGGEDPGDAGGGDDPGNNVGDDGDQGDGDDGDDGDDDPNSGNTGDGEDEDEDEDDVPGPDTGGPLGDLVWKFTCGGTTGATAIGDQGMLFTDGGDRRLPAARAADGFGVRIEGEFCRETTVPRDVVFIIDVSNSMSWNDRRRRDGGCGRMDALTDMIENAGLNTRFGLVSFSDAIKYRSPGFSPAEAGIEGIVPGENPDDRICAWGGNTHYDKALTAAGEMLDAGTPGNLKEIYFISDGQPTREFEGREIAKELRDKGVIIAGVMLDGRDRILENEIVSRDENGRPFFSRVATSGELSRTLAGLAVKLGIAVEGATLSWGAPGDPQDTDLMPVANNGMFELIPPGRWSPSRYPDGIEVTYTYWLTNREKHETKGRIIWE